MIRKICFQKLFGQLTIYSAGYESVKPLCATLCTRKGGVNLKLRDFLTPSLDCSFAWSALLSDRVNPGDEIPIP